MPNNVNIVALDARLDGARQPLEGDRVKLERVILTENQKKVIKDKYLRDAPSVEDWLWSVAKNIALAELLFDSGVPREEVFRGVRHEVTQSEATAGERTELILLHVGQKNSNDQDSNHRHFIQNLNRLSDTHARGRKLVEEWGQKYYQMLARFEFLPNSPTLMNAGRELQQLSACYVLPIDDSIDGWGDTVKNTMQIHKSGGGTGFSTCRVRPHGDAVKSTQGVASGAISPLLIINHTTEEIKQGGTRRGANMGILPYWHPDIFDFISAKSVEGRLENFNISVAVDSKFMEAVRDDREYDLINPRNKQVVRPVRAREVFQLICENAWKTGDPGVIFLDRINNSFSNPTPALGQIEATNPCFVGSTRIATQRGLLTMEELEREGGELVVATDDRVNGGAARVVAREATHVFKTKTDAPVVRIETSHGYTLNVTDDHKVWTSRGWVEAADLAEGDELFLQPGKGIFPKSGGITPDQAELLGFLVGDGWVTEEKVGFTVSNDAPEVLDRYRGAMRNLCAREGHTHDREGHWQVTYSGPTAVDAVLGLGWAQGWDSRTKRVPSAIWRGTEESVCGFLRGLFTADGTVNVSLRQNSCSVRLAASNRPLLEDVQLLLLNLGIVSSLRLRRDEQARLLPDGYGGLKEYTCVAQYELILDKANRDRFLAEVGFAATAKQRKGDAWVSSKLRTSNEERFLTRVTVVEDAGAADVFDLTEPVAHHIIASGVAAHQCGEQPLLPYEPCNLGSISLSKFVKEGQIDWAHLERVTKLSIRFLDDVIEVNNYPIPEIERIAKGNRRIGLGVMGWAEMLAQLGLPYDSPEALAKGEEVMRFINDKSLEASEELAKERGLFPNFRSSIYDEHGPHHRPWAKGRPRNCARTTIAPTGTIAIAAGLQGGGIEPFFAMAYTRYNAKALDALKKGEKPADKDVFHEVNPVFRKVAEEHHFFGMKEEDLWKKIEANHTSVRGLKEVPERIQRVFATAHDVQVDYHVKQQAAFQKSCDNGVSKTINLPNGATVEDIRKTYLMAWEMGCKGITVYRDNCKSQQVLNTGPQSGDKKAQAAAPKKQPERNLSEGIPGVYYKFETGYGPVHIHIDHIDGTPIRVFTNTTPIGTEIAGLTSVLGILLSKYLELGGDVNEVRKHLNCIKSDKPMGFGPNRIESIPHAISVALTRFLRSMGKLTNGHDTKFLKKEDVAAAGQASTPTEERPLPKVDHCPKCYSPNIAFINGCHGPTCHECGYSECS